MARNDKYVRSVEQMSRADQREARTGMRQSFGAMIAKIAIGLMFIFICFDDSEDGLSFGATMVGICMGGALLAWGLLPYLGARRKRREKQAAEEAARTAQILNAPLHKFSDNGGVTRGICEVNEEGYLTHVVETKNIVKEGGNACVDGRVLAPETYTSMNMWGLTPQFMDILRDGFAAFLKDAFEKGQAESAEYLLPTIIGDLLAENKVTVRVLPTHDKWFGVTYKEDKASVTESFRDLIARGVYKEKLFS